MIHSETERRARELIMRGRGGPVLPWHVDQAVEREFRRGTSARQLANLKRLGYLIVEEDARQAGSPSTLTVAPDPAYPLATPKSPWVCTCSERRCRPVVSDGRRGASWAGMSGFAGFILIWAIGLAGAGVVAFSILCVGSLVDAFALYFKCEACGKKVRRSSPLTQSLAGQRLKLLFGSVLFGVGAVACLVLWLWAIAASGGPIEG